MSEQEVEYTVTTTPEDVVKFLALRIAALETQWATMTTEPEQVAAVLKEIGDLKERARDLEESRLLQIETNANWFQRMRLLEERAKDMGIRMDDAEQAIGEGQEDEALVPLMAAAFQVFVAAGADHYDAIELVRLWLEAERGKGA